MRDAAGAVRARIERGEHDTASFRAALLAIGPADRATWLDGVVGQEALPDDGPELPRDGVPYLPCAIDVVLRTVELAKVEASDVFVDVGAGAGRTGALVHLLTGASVIGIEIQSQLVEQARALSLRLRAPRMEWRHGDAAELAGAVAGGTVYFFYCPFGGARLERVLADLETAARSRVLRVACVDIPPLSCPWLEPVAPPAGDLAVYRSRP